LKEFGNKGAFTELIGNFKEAVKWNTRAASQGCKIAKYNLGWLYYMGGEGLDQDKKKRDKAVWRVWELG